MWLIGDIGGTSARLGLVEQASGARHLLGEGRFESLAAGDGVRLLADFVREQGVKEKLVGVCLGVAGPVREGRASLTNLGWVLEAAEVQAHLGVEEVILLNDLQAMAYAIPALRSDEIEWVQAGRPQEHGVMALIAAGTGLGEGCLIWDDTRWRAYPSEGGHSDFAPVDEEQIALLRFVLREHAHVSYERICSGGLGMPILYRFVKEHLGLKGREVLDEAVMRQDREAARLIVEEATQGGPAAELCQAVLALFVRILGAEAGNLALKLLPTGGLYIGGGLGVRLRSALQTPSFLQPFRAKGRYASMMEEFPVGVILHPMAGLLGAASHALAVESSKARSM